MISRPGYAKYSTHASHAALIVVSAGLFFAQNVLARAGGGNSYHSGGSSHSSGGGGGSSFHSNGGGYASGGYHTGGGGSILSQIVLIIIVFLVYYYLRKYLKGLKENNAFGATLDGGLQETIRRPAPTGSEAALALQSKLDPLFVGIQQSWSSGSMNPMRAVISDGVYHRFQIQLEMNRLQGKVNHLNNPALLHTRIVHEDRFGKYQSVSFLMRASGVDTDLDAKTGKVISGGDEDVFEEIWSFTRLAKIEGTPENRTSDSNPSARADQSKSSEALRALTNCANCGAALEAAGGSRCGHCGAVLNSGALDWVLAEITQAVEWRGDDRGDLDRFYAELPETAGGNAREWLSPQELEDRASVVFIRYHSALHRGNLAILNSFATPELVKSLGGEKREPPLHSLAVGAVDLLGFAATEGMVQACVRVKYSGSPNPRAEGEHQERILVFSKSLQAQAGKADLSSLTCPNCGGPVQASDQAKCAYCDNVLSSPQANWVLSGFGGLELADRILPPRVTSASRSLNATVGASGSSGGSSDPGAQIRILAAIITAALEDGVISQSEETTIREFARHFGLGPIFVDMLLRKAKEQPQSLAEELDPATALQWLNNFVMVAASDGSISEPEEALLMAYARRQKIDAQKVRFAMQAAVKAAKR